MSRIHTIRQELLKKFESDHNGPGFVHNYTARMDDHIKDLFLSAAGRNGSPTGLALAACGGYGRGSLAPYSDVDLLFLTSSFHRKDFTSIIELVLYPLWDDKLEIGHAVRTPLQGLNLAQEDFATLSTQLEARFLAGDPDLFQDLQKRIKRWLAPRSRRQTFLRTLKSFIARRHAEYGSSPYLLEPNVKEGQGALRDTQAIGWIGRALYHVASVDELPRLGLLSKERVEDLNLAVSFLTAVRVYLHHLSREKSDVLTFENQEEVARRLKFQGNGHMSGVEKFMQEYYTHVYRTKSTLNFFLSRVETDLMPAKVWQLTKRSRTVEKGLSISRGLIELGGKEDIQRRPGLMIRAFEVCARSGLPISHRSRELIRTHLELVDEEFRHNPQITGSFLKGLAAVPPIALKSPDDLAAMQVIELIEAYIPELAEVRAQVQHDAYHVYTVDVHQVVTLWELKKIAQGLIEPEANRFELAVMEQVQQPELLFLAALLHDIGKGRGRDHSILGAQMVPGITARLGLSTEDTELVAFLVQEHLFLPETATRRDLSEEKLIVNCAWRVGGVDRLNMLYLLTVADSRATGPEAINPWKLTLLRDLYSKIYRVLTRSDLALKDTASRTDQMLLDVAAALEDRLSASEIEAHIEKMSAHYLSSMTADQVVKHILLERRLGRGLMIFEVETREAYCEVTILTRDRPGLLSRMAGVFTLNNINILGAQVFTRASNVALDIFQVEPPPDRIHPERTWEKVRLDANRVLTGRLALNYRLANKQPLLGRPTKAVAGKPDAVVVDNDTSDFYTIVEVFTYDRLGLLYDVTQTMFELELSIYIAKISTKGDQVVDVFYVRDALGEKLSDEEQISELKEALLFTLRG